MIGWGDVYKVVVSMVPLYVAMGLGYLSVKWWRMFKPDQCDAINRFTCYFIFPFFNFNFTAGINPYQMNYRFLASDVVAKVISGVCLVLWVKFCKKGSFPWAVTSFSLSCFNNTLVLGVPLLEAMYGPLGSNLVVQSSVLQNLIWFPILLFLLECRRTVSFTPNESYNNSNGRDSGQEQGVKHCSIEIVLAKGEANTTVTNTSEDQNKPVNEDQNNTNATLKSKTTTTVVPSLPPSSSPLPSYGLGSAMKKVWAKLVKNPNVYACALGLIWALFAKRWNLEMPSIVEGSVLIMAKGGSGIAMFTMGLFMALQEKLIACGVKLTLYGMVLRFVLGPLTSIVGALALGLRSNVLQITIMTAALPQAVASFVYAQEYDLHANVLSTAVIFSTTISLPLLIGYYMALGAIH